ncbi:MAG: CARDB domain-containing protein [Candidatus Bipolaricaulia bacterium]
MRLGAVVLMGILLAGMGVVGQSGLPDLTVKLVKISPSDLEEGQAALIRAIIVNQGQGDAVDAFDVVFELDGQELTTRSLFGLRKDKSSEIQIPWHAALGAHTLTVSVDAPFSRIRESSESNNKLSLQFTVSPVAGVRSFSLDVVKLFGRALGAAGAALHFQLTDSVFTSLDNAVRAINTAAAALRDVSLELPLVRQLVPPAFAHDALYKDAEAMVTLFEAIAESFERIAVMLSIGNFDAVLENAYLLRQRLIELSQKTLEGTSFAPMQAAVAQFDRVIALAKELRDLLKGAQGRSQYQVAVELFNAFMAFGEELMACARAIVQRAQESAARFYNGDELVNGAYSTRRPLLIQWAGVMLLRLELYDLTSGALVFRSEELGPVLELTTNGALVTGTYGYRLVGITKQGARRVEIGRLLVKQFSSIPPLGRQNAPMGMSGH